MTKGRLVCRHKRHERIMCKIPRDVQLVIHKGNWIAKRKGLTWKLDIFCAQPEVRIKSLIKHVFGSVVNGIWKCHIPGHTEETLLNLFKDNKYEVSIDLLSDSEVETLEIIPQENVLIPTVVGGQASNGISYLVKTIEELAQLYFPCVPVMTVFIRPQIQEIMVKEEEKKIFS